MSSRLYRIALFVLFLITVPQLSLLAQEEGKEKKVLTEETNSQKSRGEGDAATKPEAKLGVNTEAGTIEAPAFKGGETTRGASYSYITFDNWTPWIIHCYVDDVYWGTVAPYSKVETYTVSGRTKLYAVAYFDDGSYRYWGPNYFTAADWDSYNWKLKR